MPETPETPQKTEVPEVENEQKTTLLVDGNSIEEPENETEVEETIILAQKNTEQTPKQSNSKLFEFFSAILLSILFVSLLIYSTQPRKKYKIHGENFKELTDYLLVKEKKNKEYELRDF